MPRQAHGRSPLLRTSSKPIKHKPGNTRALDAFAIAQHEIPSKIGMRQNRLGEISQDEDEADEDDSEWDEPSNRHPKKRIKLRDEGDQRAGNRGGFQKGSDVRHVGLHDDDEDSEIDSDEAMGFDDSEKDGKIESKRRIPDKASWNGFAPSDSASSTSEDESGPETVDLATALDQQEDTAWPVKTRSKRSVDDDDTSEEEKQKDEPERLGEGDQSSMDTTMSGSEGEQSELSVSEDEDKAVNNGRLKSFLTTLDRKEAAATKSPSSRPYIPVGQPGDHNFPPSEKLAIADLLPTLTDPRLRASVKMLYHDDQKGAKASTKGVLGKLDPPLPKRQQDQLDREAAYEKTKETLERWVDTVKQNRRAEHVSFPLPDPESSASQPPSHLLPTAQSECKTPLEVTVQKILQESGLVSRTGALAEENLQAFEELQSKKLPPEEVQFRRAELRKNRELMFREEIKARRIKKIKSKAYRRVHRRDREKTDQQIQSALAAAGALDSDAEREKQERRRAQERMGQRHRESKWAKGVKDTGRAAWDENARSAVNDMAARNEALRMRVAGVETNHSDQFDAEYADADSSSADDVSIDEYDEVKEQAMKQELSRLENEAAAETAESRLSAMPFMKKAESRRQAENRAEIDETRRLLTRSQGDDDDDDDIASDAGRKKEEAQGRQRFGSSQNNHVAIMPHRENVEEFEEPLSGEEVTSEKAYPEPVTEASQNMSPQRGTRNRATRRVTSRGEAQPHPARHTDNPWLSAASKGKEVKNTSAVILENRAPSPVLNRLTKSRLPEKPSTIEASMEDWTSSSGSASEEMAETQNGYEATSQRNKRLVQMAFAGDDVFHDFAAEKKATVEEEGDQIEDNSLPGWGSWTGVGISKKERKKAKARQSTTTIKGIDPRRRKDARLERVIINEKRCKKVGSSDTRRISFTSYDKEYADQVSRMPVILLPNCLIHLNHDSNMKDLFACHLDQNGRPRPLLQMPPSLEYCSSLASSDRWQDQWCEGIERTSVFLQYLHEVEPGSLSPTMARM